ncbi:PIN/TRAM domain-containing protein [Sulfobacillus thermosulfidooxidans]|uniref:PIN/TRAM domain-containing protein n=1 Tax=Sulfobacillus thermosulfidooxidans TaxID=28034 RepID=A0A1R0IL66_SULTH|nr:PIN/TRAM domain-containing protein [Sulfobacillus thermosulfidooxidans]OLZ10989.1 twitching motility protein PilT [Sulfobacillus thermosulfidooxidans]OLZ14477.1 twitching motility protein PilT [Sulfobacillus thermosulfidooxidans]OLZ19220.1 twitching motility protein PilT [Sulfobacillus thermosulfidooxidans]PSR25322.1 MAG: PIN/TRAM domain-containing protein [Sulfobacillus thermosulfidooxidans]
MGRTVRQILTIFGGVLGIAGVFQNLHALKALPYLNGLGPDRGAILLGIGLIGGGLIAYILGPWLINGASKAMEWGESRLQKTPTQDLLSGSVGLIVGLLIAFLLTSELNGLGLVGVLIRIAISVGFGYVGLRVSIRKKDELMRPQSWLPRVKHRVNDSVKPKILDTSVIIDGRIADICQTGFLEGPLVIPGFVLEELRHIADSADVLKRNRGRRGLDILNHIQKELKTQVQVYERDVDPSLEVDSKLLKLAKILDGKVITNDFNLNKVAELQGVPVLNINELANAVKPVVLPGEEMVVHVIKDGKESGQGIGYLDDGTMIVVDGGRKFIGQTVTVIVTSVLQTAAGRMIFAKLKSALGAVELSEA